MTKKDYWKLTKGSFNIFDTKNVNLQDSDVLSYNDCLILVNLYRLIIEKQNNKIKTLKRRRDKWKGIATSESNLEELLNITPNSQNNKSIYKYIYNSEKEKQIRLIKLENLKAKKEIKKLKEQIVNLEMELEESLEVLDVYNNRKLGD